MQTVTADSLLNEDGFLAELSSLDEGMTLKRQSQRPPVEQRAYEPIQELPVPVRTTAPGVFVDEDPVADEPAEGLGILGRIAAAGYFVLMTGVGAVGAALVFHTQVARILATW